MTASPSAMSRRTMLRALGSLLAIESAEQTARADDHGRVDPPIPVPDCEVTKHDGAATRLPSLLEQHATALQVMFTACNVSCPIQGAIFQRVQTLIPDQVARGILLLSLSVDPDHDEPPALRRWLERFHARPGWVAATPSKKDLGSVRSFSGPGRNPADNHTTQVLILNRHAKLVFRTFELPEADEIAAMLKKL